MKRIINKLMLTFILAFILLFSFINNKIEAKSSDLDRIDSYIITVDPNFKDGSLDIKIDISWTVLNDTSEGPLEWVKIGIPNYHAENIMALTNNIKKIKYYSDDGSFIRIDFNKKYYKNETVDFSFSFNQLYMYKLRDVVDKDGEKNYVYYNYNPGYFNSIKVTKCVLKWNATNVYNFVESSIASPIIDGYYVLESPLSYSETISVNVSYLQNIFETIDPNKTYTNEYEKYPWLMPVIVLGIFALVIILVIVIGYVSKDPYKTNRGFYGPNYFHYFPYYYGRYRSHTGVSKTGKIINPPSNVSSGGHHVGGGCACACACACAGGGRAGCSMKDFYHTNLKSSDVKKVLNDKK